MKLLLTLAVAFFLAINFVSAAHFIVGIVDDAWDGEAANGHTAFLWNPARGMAENLTDIIGPAGNSGADNIYMFDCEMLANGCDVDDTLKIRVINTGDDYVSEAADVVVTGAGFDVAADLRLNSKPNITEIIVDDNLNFPENEVDLIPASVKKINCTAIVTELDLSPLSNPSAEFFHSSSFYGGQDDNNFHYTNSTCSLDENYGDEYESLISCDFLIAYYATPGNWECKIRVEDNLSISGNNSDPIVINSLLAIGTGNLLNFGPMGLVNSVSDEKQINLTNFGNVPLNLSLKGYAVTDGDGWAMNCTHGNIKNISISYEKFNLTSSNSGDLSLEEFDKLYSNLTSTAAIKKFDLSSRVNDILDDAFNSTYWRIYVPQGAFGSCSGNIVVGAVQAPGD